MTPSDKQTNGQTSVVGGGGYGGGVVVVVVPRHPGSV
jgi:hypothetical protein